MLRSVSITNVAVIKELNIDFDKGFTVLTGETGAGKSIIIDSLAFVLGSKGNRDMIRTGESGASVSALFDGVNTKSDIFDSLGIDTSDGELFIIRTISEDGKTAAKINGKSVSATVLRQVGKQLLTIHGQNDSGVLSEKGELLVLLDSYIGLDKELADYTEKYEELSALENEYEELKRVIDDREMMLDILKYQYSEIEGGKLSDPLEEEKLLRLRSKLRSLEKVSKSVSVVKRTLDDNEKGLSARYLLEKAEAAVRSLDGILDGADEMAARLETIKYELVDISERVSDVLSDDDVHDPERQLDMVEKRLTVIRKLTKKYGETIEEVLLKKDEIKNKIKNLENSDEAVADLENKINDVRKLAEKAAAVLSEKRLSASAELNMQISSVLKDLDMPKVRFKISIKKRVDSAGKTVFDSKGYDDVEFLVSPNVGEDMLPISRIASGGELSRIMLAIKNTMISKSGEDTSVFDEIDAGVSGATSERIGRKLSEMSEKTQIICITHSAQIAAIADTHLRISKSEKDGRVESRTEVLDRQGRIEELSRIIGGINITDKQIKAAVEMLDKSKKA